MLKTTLEFVHFKDKLDHRSPAIRDGRSASGRWLSVLTILLIVSGCGAASDNQTVPAQPAPVKSVKPAPGNTMKELPENPNHPPAKPEFEGIPGVLLDKVRDAIAAEGVDRNSVKFERAEPVTWPDGSLGCPQPNMMYTQALVEGYWLVAHAEGVEYDYRVARNGGLMRCTGSTKQPPIRYDDGT